MTRGKREQTAAPGVILPYEKSGEYTVEALGEVQDKPVYSAVKRTFDIVVSALALAVLLVPMLLIAALVSATSEGGPLFAQERLGKDGKPFMMRKFRTMRVDAEKDGAQWSRGEADQRITKVGAFLRKVRLDELPQLWNILKGEMSFVGPRPERKVFYDEFETYTLNKRTIPFLLLLLVFVAVIFAFPRIFLEKFVDRINGDYLVYEANLRGGDSRYLTWLHVSTVWGMLLSLPLRMFYLLFSPMPSDWRGLLDVVAFLFDSMLYFIMIIYSLKNARYAKRKCFIKALSLGLLLSLLVFGVGTMAAGGAMRHRYKFFFCFLFLVALTSERSDGASKKLPRRKTRIAI